jgi:hypothetical protein
MLELLDVVFADWPDGGLGDLKALSR